MKINIRSLIEGLSYALDVAEKTYLSHSKHVAYLSIMLAKELGLPMEDKEDLYYAALLHDIGASNTYLTKEHCIIGRDILIELPIKDKISEYVYYHHEYFNGTGPFKLSGDEIPMLAQIICISNSFDTEFGKVDQINIDTLNEFERWLNDNQKLFNPILVSSFHKLIKKEFIFLDYYSHEFNNVLCRRVDIQGYELDIEGIKVFAKAFSEIIDMRSKFTYEHSIGISNLVTLITKELGYNCEIQNKMHIAALLHDIGKLAISNNIIDKEGNLDDRERYEMNKHTYYTRWILEQIEGFEDITNYASNHHEKLNGKGYPFHLSGEEISELDRVMSICDIYQALTEERPYRNKMPIDKVWLIIDEMVKNNELDGNLVRKIKDILDEGNVLQSNICNY